MTPALEHCLRAPTTVPPRAGVAEWWPRWRSGSACAERTVDQAILGGFDADRVGWAFAAGYQAALRALLPQLPADAVAAFCVTEEGGNRPRDIHTRFTPLADGAWSLDGAKRWTTLGPESSVLLVVGALPAAAAGERPRLKVARLAAGTPGLTLLPMPETRFVPEVPHARVELDAVRVEAAALLPGDGYAAYVKPFRTIEDTHVMLAVLAYLLREARARGWPSGFGERLCAVMLALAAVADAPADGPATHVALGGALALAHGLYAEAGTLWAGAAADDPAAQRWARDAALFGVAAAARSQRAARAWERLGPLPAP
jgi:alkylation response protein AidB-like acyl-CoA dehydrogenase